MDQELKYISTFYDFGDIDQVKVIQQGHINRTYLVTNRQQRKYIVQRINPRVFLEGKAVMHNILQVTSFLKRKIKQRGGDVHRETLSLVPLKCVGDSRLLEQYMVDMGEAIWRSYYFIESSECHLVADSISQIYEAAKTYGQFHADLVDFPIQELNETIVDFHNTPKRYDNFVQAVTVDVVNRVEDCQAEIDFALARQEQADYLIQLQTNGQLPTRVTHNDTKLSNILFDSASGKGLAVIDLDTLMPGLLAYDFGDIVRSGATYAAEDETDLSKVVFEPALYEAIEGGFLAGIGNGINQIERETLAWGARLMTLECGIRFLTDYLQGDQYFKVARPEHNLDRARTQFKLVADMEICFGC